MRGKLSSFAPTAKNATISIRVPTINAILFPDFAHIRMTQVMRDARKHVSLQVIATTMTPAQKTAAWIKRALSHKKQAAWRQAAHQTMAAPGPFA